MFIELTEALDCPDCREGLGLVAFIDRLDDRRVVEGHLGCPACEAEYRIYGGAIELAARPPGPDDSAQADPDETPPAAPRPEGAGASERALHIAALLGLRERKGSRVLLGEGLGPAAPAVVEFGEQVEILVLTDPSDPEADADAPSPSITPIWGARPDAWPTRAGALNGVALLGGTPEGVHEAERALRPGGRLVVLEPASDAADLVRELDFELLADEPQALVAERR